MFVHSFVRSSVTSFSRDWLISFFWFLAQRCKMAMPKMWRSPIFGKNFFSGRKCRKYAGKTGFLAFSRDFIISFFYFFAQRCVLAMPITWASSIFEKNFFPAENAGNIPEINVFADFVWTFSLYFVIFSLKNIMNNNAHH